MAFDTPGVSIEYKTDGPLVIRAASTSTAVFIGPTVIGRSVVAGEVTPTFVSTLSEYGDVFSTPGARAGIVCLPTAQSPVTDAMGLAVRGFFMNGGQNAYIVSTSLTAATRASVNLSITDGGGNAFYRADAKSLGAWGNDVNIAVAESAIAGDFVDVTVSLALAGDDGPVSSVETFTGVAAADLTSITSNIVDFVALEADPGGTPITMGADGGLAGGRNSGNNPAAAASADLSLALDGGGNAFYSAQANAVGGWGNAVQISVVASATAGEFVDVTITGTRPGDTDPTVESFPDTVTTDVQSIVSSLVSFTPLGADPGGTPITLGAPGNLAGGLDVVASETASMGLIFEALRDFDDISIIAFPNRVWPGDQADYALALAHCQRMKDRVTLIQLGDDQTDFANVSVPLDKFGAVYYPQARITLPTPGGGSATATTKYDWPCGGDHRAHGRREGALDRPGRAACLKSLGSRN